MNKTVKLFLVYLFILATILFAQVDDSLPHSDSIPDDSLSSSSYENGISVGLDSLFTDSIYDFLHLGSRENPFLIDRYQIKERIDFSSSLVYYEIYRDSILVGVKEVIPLKDYFIRAAYNNILDKDKSTAQRTTPESEQAFDRMGLIPDIELPRVPLLGEGSRINISGSDRITFGGRQTFTEGFTQTTTPARLFPELKMEQQLRVNLEGTIGERTKVLIDHDSQRDLAGRNTVKLTYTGTEDDVLQNLEFGDTRLVIPGTAYTGDLPSRQGLFGVSGKAKVGGVDLYAVASREESQGEIKEFRGQTRIIYDTIYDPEFLRRTFFSIGELSSARITDLRVYVKDGSVMGESAKATVLLDYPDSIPAHYPYDREIGLFSLKTRNQDYTFHEDDNVIEFIRNTPGHNQAVAISYVLDNIQVGGIRINQGDTSLVLKLIKPSREDTLSWCWNYELKNVFSIGARDVKIEEIKILRYEQGADPTNYSEIETDGPTAGRTFINILNLDPDNNGLIEWPEIDEPRGLLIFPIAHPFNYESLSVRNRIIYFKNYPSAIEDKKYLIVLSYTTSRGSFNLGQFDIEEGSEKVYVNNQLQSPDDYEINYTTGELKFKKVLPANADVKVSYEYRPLFSLAQKSLLGSRGEWKFADNGKIGSSIFYRQEVTSEASTKVTLGSEPFQRLIAETDIAYTYKPEFVTDLLDKIPLLNTQGDASLSFSSEGAISLPNPNTRGIIYLDDFEKSTISQDILMRGLVWQFSSKPVHQETTSFARERIFWYNPTTRIRKDSIYGSGIGEEGKDLVDYMRIQYAPDAESSWAGIMTCVSQSGWNLKDIENLEIVFRQQQDIINRGTLHFTIATSIDEDAPRRTRDSVLVGYNNQHDTEDKNSNAILDEGLGEDVGIDGVTGDDNLFIAGDDGNDDYDAFLNPIGTESNRRLDDEDIDGNGFSRNNDYYEYSIPLSDSTFFTNLANNWKLLRIPLSDSSLINDTSKYRSEGIPNWEDIRVVRVWFSDFEYADTFDIYSLGFVGSRWRNARVMKPDTIINPSPPIDPSEKVQVALISQKTDPNYFSPFELRRDASGQIEYEASLAFSYDSIKPGHQAIAVKSNFQQEDYRDYGIIKIYVHNDYNDPYFFFRFGGDSSNFYGYNNKISSGKAVAGYENWFEFEIDLDTAVYYKTLKVGLDTAIGNYYIYGTPSIADIRYQALGVDNRASEIITGNIWFNDIRLAEARAEIGYGWTSNAAFNLADFASINFNFNYSDPNFRRFSEGRGVKTGGFGQNLGFTARAALDKFLPTSWGISIPISFRRTNNRTLPKYHATFSDYRLDEAEAEEQTQTSFDEQWALNNLSKRRSSNAILNYTVEAISYSMGQRKTKNVTYTALDTSISSYKSIDYAINPDLKITLFDNDIYLFPNTIRAGLDISDSRSARYTSKYLDTLDSRIRKDTLIRIDTLKNADLSLELEYSPLDDFNIGYSLGSSRDLIVSLSEQEKLLGLNAGVESDNEENFNVEYEFEISDYLRPQISYDGSYDETRPKTQGEYTNLRNFDSNTALDFSTDLNLPEVFSALGDLNEGAGKVFHGIADLLEEVSFSYSKDWAINYQSVSSKPPLLFRLGLSNQFNYDTFNYSPPIVNRQNNDDISIATGARIKNFAVNARFAKSWDKQFFTYDVNANRTTSWPDFSVSMGSLEKLLFGLATSSDISSGYRLETSQGGTMSHDTFRLEGFRQTTNINCSPLIAWRTTWKRRLSTNLSANYSKSKEEVRLTQGSNITESNQSGANFSLSYAFSAPQGIPIPFLKKVKLSSDLNMTWNLRYAKTHSTNEDYLGNKTDTRNDQNIGTDIASSYRISNSIESGITAGYSAYTDVQRGRKTKNVDLNFWVLFKF
jgi:hypothetical protein